jgi:ribokinase
VTGSILVVGAINTDLVATMDRAPAAGETITATSFATFGGGKGANQAVSAARNEAAVVMLGACGDDDYGRARMADLETAGISTAWVRTDPDHSSGVALIYVETHGENRIAYVPGATLAVPVDHCVAAMEREQPGVVLATNELPLPCLQRLFAMSRTAGSPVIFNATPDPELARSLLPDVDILIVNEGEARSLLGLVGEGQVSTADVRSLLETGPGVVVVTLGERGAMAMTDGALYEVVSPPVEVIDTTGAGDAFCGALAASVARGEGIEKALRYGVFAGSIAATVAGAQTSSPTRKRIEAMMTGQFDVTGATFEGNSSLEE